MAYPPGWRTIKTDPGTVSGALLGSHGLIRGYLNATPKSGAETLANWARFRPAHNGEEGGRESSRRARRPDFDSVPATARAWWTAPPHPPAASASGRTRQMWRAG